MATLETASLLEDEAAAAAATAGAHGTTGWKPSAVAGDIATLGTGTLLSALFNVGLVFVVPRLISVEDYGYWRLFGLYAGYVGFLHFGFADGALVRWAGRTWGDFHHEIRPAFNYLFWQHVIVLLPLCLVAALVLHGPLRFVAIAVAIFSVVMNAFTLLQFGLQDAKIFAPVAIALATAPALFFGFILLWAAKWRSDYREVSGLYIASWLTALIFLLIWTKPWSGARVKVSVKGMAKDWLQIGWPIVLANTGVILIQAADRFAVSWAATIQNFAQYSFAATAMGFPMLAIQTCSNVFFSHLAGVAPGGRKRIYGISGRLLLMAWAVMLPYYFALDAFVRHFLPSYVPSLPYARVMLLGIPFFAAIQILQMSYAYLGGVQRKFLAQTLVVLGLSFGITSLAAFHGASLQVVAGVQVAILGGWWLFNEWSLRDLTGESLVGWLKFLVLYTAVATSYFVISLRSQISLLSLLLYFGGIGAVAVLACASEFRAIAR